MGYTLQFGQITQYLPYLAGGAVVSLELALLSIFGGMLLGLFGALGKTAGGPWLRRLVNAYVVFFTNTPLLVQVYFLYFGLPAFGILLNSFDAVLLGMTINAGAYLTEIQRAGFLSVHRNEIEAAETLGMSRLQSVRYVILPHIVRSLYPALTSHFTLMTLGSSMAAIFGVEELTGRAFNVNSITFRSIEIFLAVAVMYVIVTLILNLIFVLVGRYQFRVRMRVF